MEGCEEEQEEERAEAVERSKRQRVSHVKIEVQLRTATI